MPDGMLTPGETDDSARDAVALLRAWNAGDETAVRAILDHASLKVVVRMLVPLALGFVEMRARADGFTGDDSELREFVEDQLRESAGILFPLTPSGPHRASGDGEPPSPM